jgi:hypothetical protein
MRARREVLTLYSLVVHLPYSACKVKLHGVGEGESDLRAEFTSFPCQDLLEQMLLKRYQSDKCFSLRM